MTYKKLGKISRVEFGIHDDYPNLVGIKFTFSGVGWGVQSGVSAYVEDESDEPMGAQNQIDACAMLQRVKSILKDAKVKNISELIGKPVEVTFDNNLFKDFRILTEVL